ncbi:MAG: hypothetical protein IPJ84_11210 [Bdellovibrionales bacterium]|nr:hypothetical protein [Bdellovibrionales bacterium]
MKFNIRSFALPLLVLTAPVSAWADGNSLGLFLEPMATYELGSTSTNYPSPLRSSSGNIDGLGIGARVGFHFSEALFAGGDLRYSMPRFDDSSVNYNAKAVSTNWGLVVGMQMPTLGLRVWGTYLLGGELNPRSQQWTGCEVLSGSRIPGRCGLSGHGDQPQPRVSSASLRQYDT